LKHYYPSVAILSPLSRRTKQRPKDSGQIKENAMSEQTKKPEELAKKAEPESNELKKTELDQISGGFSFGASQTARISTEGQ
jgi:hypothetical protein